VAAWSGKGNSTALMLAARVGQPAVVAWLLGAGGAAGTLEARVEDGTAFLLACDRGQLECARALAAAGCDVAAVCNVAGHTALMAAAGEGHGAVVTWLLGEGGAVGTLQARNKGGDTAFLLACYTGRLECARALAAAGCDVAAASSMGSTALMLAARKDQTAVVAWLLGEGGAVGTLEARHQDGHTAFLLACNNGCLECARALAAAGCDVAASSKGTTALMLAANSGHATVVEWLLGEGGAVGTMEARDEDGATAFLWACAAGRLECAQVLVVARCDVTAASSAGNTGLIIASNSGHGAVVAWLIEHGCSLEARDERGLTAFLQACLLGQLDCVELLAAAGCNMGAEASIHGMPRATGKALAQTAGHAVVVGRLGELERLQARVKTEMQARELMEAGEHRAAAALLAKLLRQAPGDVEQERLLAEAERLLAEANAAADVLARAAEAELLAMEAGEPAAGSSKVGKKKGKKKRQQERARAAAAAEEAAARALEPEPELTLEAKFLAQGGAELTKLLAASQADGVRPKRSVQASVGLEHFLATPQAPSVHRSLERRQKLDAGGGAEGVAAACSPLIHAAERGDLAELEALLAAGADMEARDEQNGNTAFLWACDAGQLECAQALAAAGCDAAATNFGGGMGTTTALMFAASKGQTAVVAWLLGEGGAAGMLEARDEETLSPDILWACAYGQLECARALAAAGCNVAAASSGGVTALMCAARKGQTTVVVWLLGEGGVAGMLEARDENGGTAFSWACDAGQLGCAQVLAAAGCGVAATSNNGNTALILAANSGHGAVVAWLLGEGGAAETLESRNKAGLTAFLQACAAGQLESVEVLARAGCDMDAASNLSSLQQDTRVTGKRLAQTAGHAAVAVRLGELEAECAVATQRREAEELMAAGGHRAAAALLAKLLRQAPRGDAELERLLAEAERRRDEANAAADVLARAAEAELLAMEEGEQAAGSSKVGKKKGKKKRQQERARAAAARAQKPELEPEPEPELPEPELEEPELEEPEPELESSLGPMAEFDEAAVLVWLASVPGLTVVQRVAVLERMEEDEYDGEDLAAARPKSMLRLLRGTAGEEVVPQVLAARDAQLEAELASELPSERPSCAICMEPYSAAGGVVPRVLRCGHAFCEACLAQMLRCAGINRASPQRLSPATECLCTNHGAGPLGRPLPANGAGKRLECPTCRKECVVKGGRAAELPVVYDMQGP
jgi:ankyrin repeat protein